MAAMSDVPPIRIRRARAAEAPALAGLMDAPAAAGLILPRTPAELAASIAAFLVAEADGRAVGCVALRDYGAGLCEVRSLVVCPECMGRGLGSRLVAAAVSRARRQHAHSVFALTYHPRLFERLGFQTVAKEQFPQKVWADCRKCRKRHHCDEIAVFLDLTAPARRRPARRTTRQSPGPAKP
ncbi:MAG: Amino-acid acetyltransferase [Lentisphaerae bacterium ADurb.BinA184]|nr:MAG: Amino-acid acetyltransferase [Lentisphaerae bacterium ADurb.BinA184]